MSQEAPKEKKCNNPLKERPNVAAAPAGAAAGSTAQPTIDLGKQPRWTRLPIRTRPHRNPLADNDDVHPDCPAEVEASLNEKYPMVTADGPHKDKDVEFADVGCAFGGMLFALAPLFPDTLMLGLEIRSKVVGFAQGKAKEIRENASEEEGHHHYNNVWFDQLNVMKFGSNYFKKGQLSKLFFCHPDPHWKRKNIRRRIIGPGLVHEYAYWLKVGGLLYTCSDVPELEKWMVDCLDACPLFERVPEAELEADEFHTKVINIVVSTSEDAQRAERKGLPKNFAVHRRIAAPPSSCSLELVDIHEVEDCLDGQTKSSKPQPAAFQRPSFAPKN